MSIIHFSPDSFTSKNLSEQDKDDELVDIEDLGQQIVDSKFDKWRREFESENNMTFDNVKFTLITSKIWGDVSNIMLGIIQEEFEGQSEGYILSAIKQRVDLFKNKLIFVLSESLIEKERGIKAKNVYVLSFGNKK